MHQPSQGVVYCTGLPSVRVGMFSVEDLRYGVTLMFTFFVFTCYIGVLRHHVYFMLLFMFILQSDRASSSAIFRVDLEVNIMHVILRAS